MCFVVRQHSTNVRSWSHLRQVISGNRGETTVAEFVPKNSRTGERGVRIVVRTSDATHVLGWVFGRKKVDALFQLADVRCRDAMVCKFLKESTTGHLMLHFVME